MLFSNEKLTVRLLNTNDGPILVKWLNDERVLEFYEGRDRPHSFRMVEERFLSKVGFPVTGCIMEYEKQAIAYIQFYPLGKEDKERLKYNITENIYGIDQFIGEPDYWNKGIGTLLVTSMADYLFTKYVASKVIMDPQVRNVRAIRCYEKCGFQKVIMLPNHELHEGILQDCWLMEKPTNLRRLEPRVIEVVPPKS